MTVLTWFGMVILGGAGALTRSVVDRAITRRHTGVYPLGIFVVNMAGTFALGVMTGVAASHDVRFLIGTGFLGGFTTFSTWIVDSRRLVDVRLRREAAANIVLALFIGLWFATLGWAVGAWLGGSTRF